MCSCRLLRRSAASRHYLPRNRPAAPTSPCSGSPGGQATTWSSTMTNAADVADRYIALWNETNAEVRKLLLAKHWAHDATYVDPMMSGKGTAEIDGLIGGV